MKLKYYLRGIGTGIIFTAIILTMVHSYKTTDTKIIERARELGMVMPYEIETSEDKSDKKKPDESDSKGEATKDISAEDETKKTTTEASEEATTKKQENTTTEPVTIKPAETEENTTKPPVIDDNAGNTVSFVVTRGMTSEAVSQKLKEQGLINNVAEFNSFLISGGYADRIRVGTFIIEKGSSYEQIAKAISAR